MNVSVAEAKAKFSELLKRAEPGEEILITRHGKAVAKLSAPQEAPRNPTFWRAERPDLDFG